MSSSQSKYVIPGITDTSSISELIAVLRSSFRKEIFDEVEGLLIRRERKLENELQVLRGKYVLLQQDHSRSVLKEISVGEELKNCRAALQESVELVDRLRAVGEMEKDAEMAEKLAQANEEALDNKNSLENLTRLVDSLRGEIVKELGSYVPDNSSNDCQPMGIEVEGGLPVSGPEVNNRSVSPRQFSDGGYGVHGQVGSEKIQSELDENVDQTSLGAVKDATAPLVPAAVTNRSLCPLEVISGVNDLNEARALHQISPEAIDEANPHIPAPFCDLTLSPRKTSESDTRTQEHDLEEAVASDILVGTNNRSLPLEIIEIESSDDESPVSQTLKRQRIILD